ncbi:MAG: hypothetical protein GY760_07330 [Deltaproteobacteria bacterium]|nr:hypothetical protein [Deltaproteobacteria bacterium]
MYKLIRAEELLKRDLDPIPKYRLMRNVLRINKNSAEMINVKKQVLETKLVREIVDQQRDDGSWVDFHSMAQITNAPIRTEQAIRRLLLLGLDQDDLPVQKVFNYMEKFLLGELDYREPSMTRRDWDLLTKLFTSCWMLSIDRSNSLSTGIAEDWARVISHAFSGETFRQEYYNEAYYDIHKSPQKPDMWGFLNYYVIAILPGFLSADVEFRFLDYILNSDQGIIYIHYNGLDNKGQNKRGVRPFNEFPDDFCSTIARKYIDVYELISLYPSAKEICKPFTNWIYENILEDGFWDLGSSAKDNINLPLSNSWRKRENRKIDCTVRIQSILAGIENS